MSFIFCQFIDCKNSNNTLPSALTKGNSDSIVVSPLPKPPAKYEVRYNGKKFNFYTVKEYLKFLDSLGIKDTVHERKIM